MPDDGQRFRVFARSGAMEGRRMSPTIHRESGYRFLFFSRKEKRMHIHVSSHDGEVKFWLAPRIELARNYRLNGGQMAEVQRIVEAHADEFRVAWKQYFGS